MGWVERGERQYEFRILKYEFHILKYEFRILKYEFRILKYEIGLKISNLDKWEETLGIRNQRVCTRSLYGKKTVCTGMTAL